MIVCNHFWFCIPWEEGLGLDLVPTFSVRTAWRDSRTPAHTHKHMLALTLTASSNSINTIYVHRFNLPFPSLSLFLFLTLFQHTGLLADEYPDVYRFVTAVFPSVDDDVVTSPYNAMLALNQLTEHADCVMPVENNQLADICAKIQQGTASGKGGRAAAKKGSAVTETGKVKHPFDKMNNIVAHMLLHLTASSRFEGSLNVDINEISMNLVPFPSLHYLCAGLSPLYALADVSFPPRRLDQMFTDAVSPEYQLTKTDPRRVCIYVSHTMWCARSVVGGPPQIFLFYVSAQK